MEPPPTLLDSILLGEGSTHKLPKRVKTRPGLSSPECERQAESNTFLRHNVSAAVVAPVLREGDLIFDGGCARRHEMGADAGETRSVHCRLILVCRAATHRAESAHRGNTEPFLQILAFLVHEGCCSSLAVVLNAFPKEGHFCLRPCKPCP